MLVVTYVGLFHDILCRRHREKKEENLLAFDLLRISSSRTSLVSLPFVLQLFIHPLSISVCLLFKDVFGWNDICEHGGHDLVVSYAIY